MEYLLSNKMEWTIGAHNLDESPGDYAEWKKANSKRLHTVWSIYITFLKW